ncbi:MAG: hypothetical protein HQL47_07785 [Gammaproteobacteria bacterium]|jgi:hypothetical protein|nr:hypothetical protein [Gammaproteobacteria bacterium]
MLEYSDAFLARLVTQAKEDAAAADVAAIATFPDYWRDRLIVLRVYIQICLDAQKGGDEDVYATKLAAYRREWETSLQQAKQVQVAGVTLDPAWPELSAETGRLL